MKQLAKEQAAPPLNSAQTPVFLSASAAAPVVYLFGTYPEGDIVVGASVVWVTATLVLCLIFMLGAAQTPMQFLVFFGTGTLGAGMGYLVAAWLTPSGDSNPLDQARNVVAGVLTGVVGTKLLTLWDDLVDPQQGGGLPRILTAQYYVPIAMGLVGFTVSLSAVYSIRSGQSGDVRVTYSPQSRRISFVTLCPHSSRFTTGRPLSR